jgi:type III pantothenate kinase
MRLIIDIGNNFTKLASAFNENSIENIQRFKNNEESILNYIKTENFTSAIISSVGNPNLKLTNILKKLNIFTIILNHNTPIPIKNLYETPQTLGLDRLAAIVGAYSIYPNKNILIFDAGTALTIDFLNSNGEYLGGNISPGLEMRFKALNAFTHKLPLLEKTDTVNYIGNSTKTAIISGVQQGMLNEMEGYINKFAKNYENLQILITGGDSFFFENKLKNNIFANSNLVLIGLNNILSFND